MAAHAFRQRGCSMRCSVALAARKVKLVCTFLVACLIIGIACYATFAGGRREASQLDTAPAPVPSIAAYIDNHAHADEDDIPGSIEAAVQAMPRENAIQIAFLPPPFLSDAAGKYDAEAILSAARKYPGRIVALGGGGTLNVMLQDAVNSGNDGPEVKRAFAKRANELVRLGVVGFGEISLEHLSPPNYQYAPPDHPLMLILDDIAARAGIPIVVHMEAVPSAMPLPEGLKSPPNPPQLHANIAAFEKLLDHNSNAKIIWAHAGTDYTGYRTPELCRELLERHPNLYMEIKIEPPAPGLNSPLAEGGAGPIKPNWLKLFEDFPNRFIVGTDQRYGPKRTPLIGPQRWGAVVGLLNQLPAEVRSRIALDNVRRLRPANSISPKLWSTP
jgi:predicted TIM-barrel fold metal-dependent hydrolase